MAHDVFISHSSQDKPVADAICTALENAGIRCWVAPRDVQPGRSFAGEITRAIQQSKAMVLIFSTNSNNSSQVLREVQLAVNSQLHVLQFRIEDVLLNDDLKYYLSTPHWLDAMTAARGRRAFAPTSECEPTPSSRLEQDQLASSHANPQILQRIAQRRMRLVPPRFERERISKIIRQLFAAQLPANRTVARQRRCLAAMQTPLRRKRSPIAPACAVSGVPEIHSSR